MMLNRIQPTAGKLLLSEPFMADPNFRRAVVFLTEHNESGSVGFVLNQKTDLTLENLVQELEGACYPIYIGGPVGTDSLHYVHTISNLEGSVPVGDGIYWGGDFEVLSVLLRTGAIDEDHIRFFIGYSGWEKRSCKPNSMRTPGWWPIRKQSLYLTTRAINSGRMW